MLKITNKNDNAELRIYDWVNNEVTKDICLNEKLKTKDVQTEDIVNYCCEEARKQAIGPSACIDDGTVFEWCKHFILEDIKPTKQIVKAHPKANNKPKIEKEAKPVEPIKQVEKEEVKPKKKEEPEFNLLGDFDLSGTKTDLF